jgi:Fur family transcriptional regulator, zinc uptake regulator
MICGDTIFPASDHDHQRCLALLMARAEQQCLTGNARLTPHRRRVLEIVAAGHAAIGAYDIIDRLSHAEGHAPAPISVYRALEFLLRLGLVHRVESLNAYVACPSAGGLHAAQFLICRRCRTVAEMNSPVIEEAIAAGAESAGFAVTAPVVEIGGLCHSCAGADRDPLTL